jgi:hypothetical protein
LIGVQPDDATRVLIPIAVGVLDSKLSFTQAAQSLESGRLPDSCPVASRELLAHTLEHRVSPDDLCSLRTVRDKKYWVSRIIRHGRGNGCRVWERRARGIA